MNRYLAPLAAVAVFGLAVGFYVHSKRSGEMEREAPISSASKVLPREGMTPILELPKENAEAAGIEAKPFRLSAANLIVPPSSIIRQEERTWVYLKLSDTRYSRLEVEPVTVSEQGTWRVVGTNPKSENVVVVIVGAQLLLSEELKSQVQVGEGAGG